MSINVAVLGATGSIGRQTLEVLSAMKEYGVRPVLLACAHNSAELIKKYGDRRDITVISDRGSGIAAAAKEYLGTDLLNRAETYAGIDVVINGIGGLSGVGPTIAALKAGCKLLTANKESVVAFGKHFKRGKHALHIPPKPEQIVGGFYRDNTHVSLKPPPCEELTTYEPASRA